MRLFRMLPCLLLAACGQAGDLYLPPEQAETAPAAAPSDAPPQDPDEDKGKDKK
jgi:predicted small lipoprotein YifL